MTTLKFSKDCTEIGVPEWAKGSSIKCDESWPAGSGREYHFKKFGHKGIYFSDVDIKESNGTIKIVDDIK
jgi:hypothetical protein